MQSSLTNEATLRLNAASHSVRLSLPGELGARAPVASRSAADDKAEAAELSFRLALPPAPEDESCGRADPSRQQEAHAERADRHRRKIGTQLGADVGRLADLVPEHVGRAGKLLALGLDVAADLFECPVVATGHCPSAPLSSASPRGSPAREPEATPS